MEAQQTEGKLPQMMWEYYYSLLNELFDFRILQGDMRYFLRVVNEHLYKTHPQLLETIQTSLPMIDTDVVIVSQKFQQQYATLMQQSGSSFAHDERLQQRLQAAMNYFHTKLHEHLDPVIKSTKVNIKNKQFATQYNNALDAFLLSYKLKVGIFSRMKDKGFSIRDYLSAKAQAVLDEVKVDADAKVTNIQQHSTKKTSKAE